MRTLHEKSDIKQGTKNRKDGRKRNVFFVIVNNEKKTVIGVCDFETERKVK
jgi:hypothetical protein